MAGNLVLGTGSQTITGLCMLTETPCRCRPKLKPNCWQHKAIADTYLIFGYRFGWQNEAALLNSLVQYSNTYHRLLAGVEGKPAPWLKLAVLIGPDFRDFDNAHPAAGFGHEDQIKVYVDSTITITPTSTDEVSLLVRRFVQPSYGGRAIYEDITYQFGYRHDFNRKFSATLTLKDYEGDWEPPVARDDIIYTASVSLSYKFNDNLVGEMGYSFDRAKSNVTDTPGREFYRNLYSIGIRYTF
jgi:hypothetical protein